MAVRGSQILYNSSASFALATPNQLGNSVGSSVGPSFTWDGGRTGLQVSAQNYGTGLMCQVQMPDSSWMQVGSGVISTFITNPILLAFDSVPGQYRMVTSGSSVGLYATLSGIQYT